MSSAIIYFADKSTIELNDGDRIIPIRVSIDTNL